MRRSVHLSVMFGEAALGVYQVPNAVCVLALHAQKRLSVWHKHRCVSQP